MKSKRTMKNNLIILALILLGNMAITSCDDNLDAWDEGQHNLAGVNFFALSETLPYYENNVPRGIGIFVDTVEYHTVINNVLSSIPYFNLYEYGKISWFPYNNNQPANNQPLYMNYAAGKHRFIFSYFTIEKGDVYQVVSQPTIRLAEAELDLDAGSNAIIFLTDDVADEGGMPAYKVTRLEQKPEKNVRPDKVSVRFIHLSMDAGALRISQLKQDGNEKDGYLLQDLNFGSASDYIQLDTVGFVSDGLLMFHVYTPDNNEPISVGVSAVLGSCFDVIIHGFTQPHTRRVITTVAEDGALTYKTVGLPAGFTTTVRQTY